MYFAANGCAAACLNHFETSDEANSQPFYQEQDRPSARVEAVTTGEWVKAHWTGENLLLARISHGSTAPLIAMARGKVDQQPSWQMSSFTAGCFLDGSPNQTATTAFTASGKLDGSSCSLHDRWLNRYCPDNVDDCDLSTNENAQQDNIEGLDPEDAFHLKTWKLTECGSELSVCLGDMLPMEPQEGLCSNIEQANCYSCEFSRLSTDGHTTCFGAHAMDCRGWLDGN